MEKVYTKILKIVMFISIILISVISVLTFIPKNNLSEKDFTLETDLSKNVFSVGEKITFTVTIANKSGKNIMVTSNGQMPCVFYHNIDNTIPHADTSVAVKQFMRINGKISRNFEYNAIEPGKYVLEIHYSLIVNGVEVQDKLDDILIEIK